jgi:hypothetical protein
LIDLILKDLQSFGLEGIILLIDLAISEHVVSFKYPWIGSYLSQARTHLGCRVSVHAAEYFDFLGHILLLILMLKPF